MDSTCDYSKKFLLTKNEYKFYQMLRRYIAKGTKIEAYSDEYIQTAQDWLNTYPRKLFDYQTSAEMFQAELRKIGIKKFI